MTPRAAFFDLDRTLLSVNSGALWFRRERAEGRLPLTQAVEAGLWMGLYGVGLLRARTALGRAVRAVAGQSEAELEERTRRFYSLDVASSFAPGGLAAVQAHREAGDTLVLLTSSSEYISRCVQEELGLDDILCMKLGVSGGRFTGEIEQLCFGAAKVTVAQQWAEPRGIDLANCWFYSDSITDLPMLERVGRAMVVHPDPRLGRVARKRGWPVLDWSAASEMEAAGG
ncbi:MAG: HAD family hydrolase [Proteobacteria bacterium]|nr:HAD family hydrolase [Pseudomonadota bacterium]